jgi:superfamily I DNA/RNA helicase
MVAVINAGERMPSVQAFCGPAGSGKTYALVQGVELALNGRSLLSGQYVVVITFMHGARRRLESRFGSLRKQGIPITCETIDSFCLRLVNRFRRYLGRDSPIVVAIADAGEGWTETSREWKVSLSALRQATAELLEMEAVKACISVTFPVVVVDEFQDCSGELLAVIEGLAKACDLLVGADPFQALTKTEGCEASRWLERNATVANLEGNRRTACEKLQSTAEGLRTAVAPPQCIPVLLLPAAGLAAWAIASKLAWGGFPRTSSRVIISPVRPASSPWLRGVLASLNKELGQKSKIGPFPFYWESSESDELDAVHEILESQSDGLLAISKDEVKRHAKAGHSIVRRTVAQATRVLSVRGDKEMQRAELREIAERCCHSALAFRREKSRTRMAMTVHGAKNREFDYVFILWPYQSPAHHLLKRKLLYNAVTRAKVEAILIVQGDDKRFDKDEVLSLLRPGMVAAMRGR